MSHGIEEPESEASVPAVVTVYGYWALSISHSVMLVVPSGIRLLSAIIGTHTVSIYH